jgi:predicted MFS family arabinose efflux permease
MALLMYEQIRKSEDAEDTILSFLESAYQAGITTGNWNTRELHLER